jgi:hypothetical protein
MYMSYDGQISSVLGMIDEHAWFAAVQKWERDLYGKQRVYRSSNAVRGT